MKFGNICERVKRFPVGAIATFLGAATISNAYALFGFVFIRHLFMIIGAGVILLNIMKITLHKEVFIKESNFPVSASIYCTLSMLTITFGSYIFSYNPLVGKIIWLTGIIFHIVMILGFTYNHLIKKFDMKFFVPSWFIVYSGIMVTGVVGSQMGEPLIVKYITYYGLTAFFIVLPFMVKRVLSNPLPTDLMHTKAVFMAPVSLGLTSYLNITKEYNEPFIILLYSILLISLVVILKNIPKFFSVSFTPTFGALTFPMAIGTVASFRVALFLKTYNYLSLYSIVYNIAGIQLFITTAILGFVIFNFLKKVNYSSEIK